MRFKIDILPRTLKFKRPAGTSRGVYTVRKVWYVVLRDAEEPGRFGVGECAPLVDLSCDYCSDDVFERRLRTLCDMAEKLSCDDEPVLPYEELFSDLKLPSGTGNAVACVCRILSSDAGNAVLR